MLAALPLITWLSALFPWPAVISRRSLLVMHVPSHPRQAGILLPCIGAHGHVSADTGVCPPALQELNLKGSLWPPSPPLLAAGQDSRTAHLRRLCPTHK